MDRIVERYKENPTLFSICIGKRGQGKSTYARDLLFRLAKERIISMTDVLILSGTGAVNPHQYAFVSPKQVIGGEFVTEPMLERIWNYQQARVQRAKQIAVRARVRVRLPLLTVIMDDVTGFAVDVSRSPTVKKLICNGRHIALNLLVLAQVSTALITPVFRSNCNLLLCSRLAEGHLKAAYQLTSGKEWKEFRHEVMEELPEHTFLCYDDIAPKDQAWFHCKAEPRKSFFIVRQPRKPIMPPKKANTKTKK